MIKVKKYRVKVKGSARQLSAEIAMAIRSAYEGALEQSEQLAEEFKKSIVTLVTLPDSPLWEKGEE